jgi:hypothetical protein
MSPISSNQAMAPADSSTCSVHEDLYEDSYEDKYEAFDDFYADTRSRGSYKTQKAGKPSQQKGTSGIYSSKHVRVKDNERRSKR